MSIPKKMTVTCPKCGANFEATVFQTLNTDYDDRVIASVISGERFNAKCPTCNAVSHLEYDILYHDLKHCAMIWVVNPNQNAYAQKLMEVRSTSVPPNYITRIVHDMNGLREKAACLATGRDDRIVELCKSAVEGQISLQNPSFVVDNSFFTCVDGKQIIYVYDHCGTEMYSFLSDQLYSAVENRYIRKLEKESMDQFQIIDRQWAIEFLTAVESEKMESNTVTKENDYPDDDKHSRASDTIVQCGYCGRRVPIDSEFCQYCGKKTISVVDDSDYISGLKKNASVSGKQEQDISDDTQILAEIALNEIDGNIPVVIEKVCLFHDKKADTYFLRCIFRSLTDEIITAVLVDFICYDIWENEVSQIGGVQYLDLKAGYDERFGYEKKVNITDSNTRLISVNLKKVRLQNGSIVDATGSKHKIPEIQKIQDYFKSTDIAQQYVRETTEASQFVPVKGIHFWRCACGEVNPNAIENCYQCKQSRTRVFELLDGERLAKNYAIYSEKKRMEKEEHDRLEYEKKEQAREAQAAAREECLRREREIAAQKERKAAAIEKKKKEITISIVSLLTVITVVYLIGWYVIPYYRYSSATNKFDDGQFFNAYEDFSSLENYSDSKVKANQALYRYACSLIDEKRYMDAVSCFEKLAGYLDSDEKLSYCTAKIKYDCAVELFAAGKYLEAYESFSEAVPIEDSEDRANKAGYQYAMECFNGGDYLTAYEMFDKILEYENSSELASEARYLYAKRCADEENYIEAIPVLEKITKYKDVVDIISEVRYRYALQLETAEDWENAYKQFKRLDKYKDSFNRYQNARYEFATIQFENKKYQEAATGFAELGYYKDSKAQANEAMWGYIDGHRSKTDITTYRFLKELKQINYKESKKMYELYYAYSVSLVAVNTNRNDNETISISVARNCPYLHFEFQLSGGPPAGGEVEFLTLTHRVYWPNGGVDYSSWEWDNLLSGETFGCYWEGFDNPGNIPTGKVTIKVYNKTNGEYLGEGSVYLT